MEFTFRIKTSYVYACLGVALVAAIGIAGYRVGRRGRPVIHQIETRDPSHASRLLRGFYEVMESWRFTDRVFAVSLDPTRMELPVYLEIDFSVLDDLIRDRPAITLTARVNHVEVGRQTYFKAGRYTFMRHVPLHALARRPAEVEFETDQVFTNFANARPQSLIVVSVGFKEYEQTAEYRETRAKLAREGYASVIEKIRGELPPGKAVEFLKLFHALPVWEYLWFQNVRIIKNPLDLWVMQQIIYEERPDFIIETGTMEGGSALYWAHTLSGMGLDGSRVITVDLHNFTQGASSHFLWKKHVLFFQGSSTDPAIVSAIARMTANKRVIVTLDSDHSRQHVLNELRAYSPMINRGSYLVVEDTHMDGVPTMPTTGPGPHAAVEQFLKEGGSQNFERDLNRESMIMTFNPGGWLRRK